MKQNDVIVIGGGLAGLFAAITAAKRGRQVMLVTKGVGAIAIGGGSIDVLGYDAQGVPVRDPVAAMDGLAADHPFANLRPCDNIFSIETDFYRTNPLILQGPGAGREVTAAAVQADLWKICATLK